MSFHSPLLNLEPILSLSHITFIIFLLWPWQIWKLDHFPLSANPVCLTSLSSPSLSPDHQWVACSKPDTPYLISYAHSRSPILRNNVSQSCNSMKNTIHWSSGILLYKRDRKNYPLFTCGCISIPGHPLSDLTYHSKRTVWENEWYVSLFLDVVKVLDENGCGNPTAGEIPIVSQCVCGREEER